MSRVQDFRMNAATLTYLLRLNYFCILFHVSCTAAELTRNSSCYKYSDCVDFGFIDEFTALVAGATTSVAVCIIAGFMFWKFQKKSQYQARLQRTQEELYELGSALTFLRKLKRGLKNQREELTQQLEDMERETEEINTKLHFRSSSRVQPDTDTQQNCRMFSPNYRHPLKHLLISFSALLVLQSFILLLLTDSCTGQPQEGKTSAVDLLVGSVSSPVIAGININSSAVVLQCESKGWYPEPEVLWLDGEGHVLSAGPTETARGPDDLYTVSSRVTVDKRHGNRFTCRVQQTNINQTRETHIKVTAKCFPAPFCFDTRFSVVMSVLLIFICAVVIFLVRWRQDQIKETKMKQQRKTEESEREKLLADEKKRDLEEKRARLNEELQRKEEEEKDLEQVVKTLEEQRKELKKLEDKLKCQKDEMEKEKENTEKRVQSVEKETENDGVKRNFGLKEIILNTHENLQVEMGRLVNKTDGVINRMMERKKEVEKLKVEISWQLLRGGRKT
ncbi:hypothetical protein Q5P01_002887 [Channa striata]|uniref:Ig-like domain-containing protein n=1 Tax=Channa striata TaxID=64152 RepID=A0AA88NSF2_CHASR|nr:hypothetical protein Q5P01_002887 [Channa striata]